MKVQGAGAGARMVGAVGLMTTTFGLCAAFLPTSDVTSVGLFETKMIVGVAGPTAFGWFLFTRAQRARRDSEQRL
jgi:hypothetical protein